MIDYFRSQSPCKGEANWVEKTSISSFQPSPTTNTEFSVLFQCFPPSSFLILTPSLLSKAISPTSTPFFTILPVKHRSHVKMFSSLPPPPRLNPQMIRSMLWWVESVACSGFYYYVEEDKRLFFTLAALAEYFPGLSGCFSCWNRIFTLYRPEYFLSEPLRVKQLCPWNVEIIRFMTFLCCQPEPAMTPAVFGDLEVNRSPPHPWFFSSSALGAPAEWCWAWARFSVLWNGAMSPEWPVCRTKCFSCLLRVYLPPRLESQQQPVVSNARPYGWCSAEVWRRLL